MVLSDISLGLEDFGQVDWERIVEQCDSKNCELYRINFSDAAKAAKDETKIIQDIYEFLEHITSPMLNSESDSEPFSPLAVWADGSRSAILKDFSDQQLNLLKELAPTIRDSDLRGEHPNYAMSTNT